jgi:transposase
MSENRQRYSDEYKEKTVKFIQEQTKSVQQISDELNIPPGTLHQWLAKHRKFENEPMLDREVLRQKDQQIQEQELAIQDLQEEIAILKKAMHIFSKERN